MADVPAAGRFLAAAWLTALAASIGGCQDSSVLGGVSARSIAPIPAQTLSLMQTKGMSQADPILVRAYKKEAEMEVWKRGASGQYALLKTYPICRWSGQLGPKAKQGDRQAPEGFYTITPGQMNPNSSYYLSFDVGYPNAVDRAKGGTGNHIMVHGSCSSSGCFAMTDASMAELYAIAREAFANGQRGFQFQSYPFRMTAQNMARFRNDPNVSFWRNLKEGSDHFEALKEEPRVASCGTRYVFGGADVASGSCSPRLDPLVAEKRVRDDKAIAELVSKGEKATRMVYDDGGQNPVFRPQPPATAFASLGEADKDKDAPYTAKEYGRHHLGDVSRPESLAAAAQEYEIDSKGRPVLVAAADAPGPTRAAAAALAGKNGKGAGKEKNRAEPAVIAAVQEPAEEPRKAPARIAVADAGGDASVYHKLLGDLFGKPAGAPAAKPEPAKHEPATSEAPAAMSEAPAAMPEPAQEAAKPSNQMAARHVARAAQAGSPAKAPATTKKPAEATMKTTGPRGQH